MISIHALREEGDWSHRRGCRCCSISIHALREEGDPGAVCLQDALLQFLSTPSARRATRVKMQNCQTENISIHALREEGDLRNGASSLRDNVFLSTPSARRATAQKSWSFVLKSYFYPRPPRGGRPARVHRRMRAHLISIHALREEGDRTSTPTSIPSGYFYPRPPRGGRRVILKLKYDDDEFLSTPSARRATPPASRRVTAYLFLSTPSARRATCTLFFILQPRSYFYPRPPRGGRQR